MATPKALLIVGLCLIFSPVAIAYAVGVSNVPEWAWYFGDKAFYLGVLFIIGAVIAKAVQIGIRSAKD